MLTAKSKLRRHQIHSERKLDGVKRISSMPNPVLPLFHALEEQIFGVKLKIKEKSELKSQKTDSKLSFHENIVKNSTLFPSKLKISLQILNSTPFA